MRHLSKALFVLALVALSSGQVRAADKTRLQAGFGFGMVSPYPKPSFPRALMGVLEGTYRWKFFGASILATATSSPKINGTYYFASQGGYQQTLLEPRVYFNIFHLGFAVGLNLSQGTTGEVQSVVSYGPMFGIEIPIGRFSIGADARYLHSSGANPSPLSTVMMFRFML